MTQNNLGIAYRNRITGDQAENVETAIAAFQQTLLVYTQTDFPVEWAMTQNNLGLAYWERIRENKAQNIEAAIAAYQQALLIYTQTDFPIQWATIQNNLEPAIAAYKQAFLIPTQTNINQDMLGLLPVFKCENSYPLGDIVFVHGLAGHPWGTWHPQGKRNNGDLDFWPFWLGEDLQANEMAVNIWTFGYDAPRFGYVGEGMPRFDLASNLWEYLYINDIGSRPLIFITHSMGGLVVKDLIRTAQNFDDKKAIIQQTQGIVFLSTPHQGSHLANLIDNFNVEELKAHTPQLRDLNQWYRQNIEKLNIKTYVFYETKPMAGVLVVDEDSANPGIKDVQPIAISADHYSIAKPGRNDLVYLSVIKFCQQIFASKKSTQGKKIEKDSTGYNMAGIYNHSDLD
jgi:tetratricopeptide (TPR) repeat protein